MIQTAILCVDDEKMVLDSLRMQLARHYHDKHLIEFALDATEGLELIGELLEEGISTVLVISDWMMPGMNGDEFLLRLKEAYPNISAVILSGQTDDAKAMALQRMNVTNAILSKPWAEEELIATIDALIGPSHPSTGS